jgi:hypothetical protein
VDVVADLPADAQSAEPVQQRKALLDHPAVHAQPGTVRNAAPRDDRGDPQSPHPLAVLVVVVAPVGVERDRSASGPSAPAAYGRDGLD